MCKAIRRTAGGNRATRWPPDPRPPGSNDRATAWWWVDQSKTERWGNWYSAAPGHRTWQIDLSLHYLSNCVNKKSDIVFRRHRENTVAQPTDPAAWPFFNQRLKKQTQLP